MVDEIRVPREIVNDDVVTIASWRFATGDRVGVRDIVALIETSKAIVEVEAGAEGYLEIACPEGAEVGVGELIGKVGDRPDQPSAAAEAPPTEAAEAEGASFSRKARQALEEHGLDADIFKGQGLVRESDVLAYVEAQGATAAEPSVAAAPGEHRVGLWRDAQLAASDRSQGILWLAFNYVWRTWLLSNLVRWSPRFAILTLHRWRGVGIGRGCFVDPSAIIETAHPGNIRIGDDVRIAANVVIMTHIKPPHFLRNHGLVDSRLAPVVLEDSCFIGVSAVIMPGVTVGQAAVVASGAVVVGDVPPFTMVAGNPAKTVKTFTRPEGH